jgi:transcriptional regulator with XRE-family HTH domain
MLNDSQFPDGGGFRARRHALGLSQEKLARLAGIAMGSVRRVEIDDPIAARRMAARVDRVLTTLEDADRGRLVGFIAGDREVER